MHRNVRVTWWIFLKMRFFRSCQLMCLAPLLLVRWFQFQRACFPASSHKNSIWEMVPLFLSSCTHVFQMRFLMIFQRSEVHVCLVAYIARVYLSIVRRRVMVACVAERFEMFVAYCAQFLIEFGYDRACFWRRNCWLIYCTSSRRHPFAWCDRIVHECGVFLQIFADREMRFADVTQISDFQMSFHVVLLCFGFSCKNFTACQTLLVLD